MSLKYVTRPALLAVLFDLVGLSGLLLRNGREHARILESTPLEILEVLIYNACCYLPVGIPADPAMISTSQVRKAPAVASGLQVVGSMLLPVGACLSLATVLELRGIGEQDSKQGLITSGLYRLWRHPIYLGTVLAVGSGA